MAVFCVPRSDRELLGEIACAERILLVGCPVCANISYAFHRNGELPIMRFTLTGIKPVYIRDEMLRISNLIWWKGVSVDFWLPNYPAALCALDEGARSRLFNQGQASDAILTLCCEAGKKNVESILPDKKVVEAMNAKGLLRTITKRRLGKIFFDRQAIDILRFTFE